MGKGVKYSLLRFNANYNAYISVCTKERATNKQKPAAGTQISKALNRQTCFFIATDM